MALRRQCVSHVVGSSYQTSDVNLGGREGADWKERDKGQIIHTIQTVAEILCSALAPR